MTSSSVRLLRLPDVQAITGQSRTTLYGRVSSGMFPSPLKIAGQRASHWPSDEVEAFVQAVIRGASDVELRALVARLAAQRSGVNATGAAE